MAQLMLKIAQKRTLHGVVSAAIKLSPLRSSSQIKARGEETRGFQHLLIKFIIFDLAVREEKDKERKNDNSPYSFTRK